MKTSNKILIAVSLLVMAYLTLYDLGLKAEYYKGAYKSPLFHMQQLKLANFNAIEHEAGNTIGLHVEKGPHGVWVNEELKDKVAVSVKNGVLTINYINLKGSYPNGYAHAVIVKCPVMDSIKVRPYIVPGKEFDPRFYYSTFLTTISGFNQPQMTVEANRYTGIMMKGNVLGGLNAKVLNGVDDDAALTIRPDNQIKSANFMVTGGGHLTLADLSIGKVKYKLTDSAQVSLTGKSLNLLRQ